MKIPLKATVYMGLPIGLRRRIPSVNRTLGIQIGRTCCALRCPDDEIYAILERLYRNFKTEQTADITVDLERTSGHNNGHVGRTLFTVLCARPDLLVVELECEVEESGVGFRCLNRLFCLAYYSVCLDKYGGSPPAVLVQACSVLRQGRGLLFMGSGQAGKTIAGLCGERDNRLLSDEVVLVSRPGFGGRGTSMQSAPIIGGFPPGINIMVPLSCILLVKMGGRTRVRPVDPVDACLRFMHQVITPSCIGRREVRSALSMVADFSQETVRSVPVYELELAADGELLWDEIYDLEGILYGKVLR